MKRQALALVFIAIGLAAVRVARPVLELEIAVPGTDIVLAGALTGVSFALGTLLYWVMAAAASTSGRTAIRTVRSTNLAATIVVTASGALWVLGSPRPAWFGLIAPLLLTILTIFGAGAVGFAAHGARSGWWRSPRYKGLVRPRDEDAEDEYNEWRADLIAAFRSRRIGLRQLRGAARLVVLSWLRAQKKRTARQQPARSRTRRRR